MRMFLEGYYRLLKILITLLMAALIVPVTMQILSRYTGMVPRYIWTEEIARFCFVWIILIGAMIAVRDGTHFDVDVLPHTQNRYVEFASKLFVHLSILVMALSFLWWGRDFFVLGARQQSEISGLPMWMIYVAWPIAGGTWAIFTVERIFDDFQALKTGAIDGAG
ncbi:TRAP transporter small permease [Roseobacter denitrificans]|uniref:TRAP transporter small permease protein n=1 Tax=Roseobacter denitrificans (strain ATCC 33942 / OCh 114) TaxID=375451 RepID=Q162K7_ROSDO|nr:TRAP transporter small permease [Roseobacter denitrificans]ABG33086.1 TRAP transporter, DctQ-like membrane protein, putative [Roseobacter denitrificans OCh 114]AVL52455.1 TRAP transporter small permease [Roseobacter denitrificans]SFG08213.1 TRAP-type C4-dicarboxylate transport system, small permease component [Roseobacter denitrificans OCh 114]